MIIRFNEGKPPAGYLFLFVGIYSFLNILFNGQEALSLLSALISLIATLSGIYLVSLPTKCVLTENFIEVKNGWSTQTIPKDAIEHVGLNEKVIQIWWQHVESASQKKTSIPIENSNQFDILAQHLPLIQTDPSPLPITLWVHWFWVVGLIPLLGSLSYWIAVSWPEELSTFFVVMPILLGLSVAYYLHFLILKVTFEEEYIEVRYLWRKKRFKHALLSHMTVKPFTKVFNRPTFTRSSLELHFHDETKPLVLSSSFLAYDGLPVVANLGSLPEYLAHHYIVPLQID